MPGVNSLGITQKRVVYNNYTKRSINNESLKLSTLKYVRECGLIKWANESLSLERDTKAGNVRAVVRQRFSVSLHSVLPQFP